MLEKTKKDLQAEVHREIFWDNGTILQLDCCGCGYSTIYILSKFKELYLDKPAFKAIYLFTVKV